MDNAVQSGNFNSKTDSKADGKTDGSEFNFAGYFGADLGAVWMPDATVFKLWAPTAVSVETVLYDPGETGQTQIAQAVPMKKSGAEGSASEVWIAQVPGDLRNAHYMYHLTFENGEETFSPDPYAKAAAASIVFTLIFPCIACLPFDFQQILIAHTPRSAFPLSP